jgi:hypothetical protein
MENLTRKRHHSERRAFAAEEPALLDGPFLKEEAFDSISPNTCNTTFRTNTTCITGADPNQIVDELNVGCNAVGGSCGLTLTNQRWTLCDDPFFQPIGSPGTIVAHNDAITVAGQAAFVIGTDIFP